VWAGRISSFKPKHETEADWQKEARFLLSLRHPNIVQIYDMFEFCGATPSIALSPSEELDAGTHAPRQGCTT